MSGGTWQHNSHLAIYYDNCNVFYSWSNIWYIAERLIVNPILKKFQFFSLPCYFIWCMVSESNDIGIRDTKKESVAVANAIVATKIYRYSNTNAVLFVCRTEHILKLSFINILPLNAVNYVVLCLLGHILLSYCCAKHFQLWSYSFFSRF